MGASYGETAYMLFYGKSESTEKSVAGYTSNIYVHRFINHYSNETDSSIQEENELHEINEESISQFNEESIKQLKIETEGTESEKKVSKIDRYISKKKLIIVYKY